MITAGQFIAERQRERRSGRVSSGTEQHREHAFRKLGWEATEAMLATAVGSEVDRLEREAATLRTFRSWLLRAIKAVETPKR
jgi:hypothetical protein